MCVICVVDFSCSTSHTHAATSRPRERDWGCSADAPHRPKRVDVGQGLPGPSSAPMFKVFSP